MRTTYAEVALIVFLLNMNQDIKEIMYLNAESDTREKNHFYMPHVKRLPQCKAMIQHWERLKMVLHFKLMRSAVFVHVLPLFVICKSFFTRFDKKLKAKKTVRFILLLWVHFYVVRQHTKANGICFVCGVNGIEQKEENRGNINLELCGPEWCGFQRALFFVIHTNGSFIIRHIKKSWLIRHVSY